MLRRVYAQRGVLNDEELSLDLRKLLPPGLLKGIDAAAEVLVRAIVGRKRIMIVGDYDADGATGVALGVALLRAFGAASVEYLVPSRFKQGYGLSPELAEAAHAQGTQLLVTVDNGISSVSGVARANALGMRVLITDHHLPGPALPEAASMVNPNQPGCGFPSKSLAGVGVMFYVLSALRAKLREAGWFAARAEPRMAEFLDLVAIGTVADVVRLDQNNRILVANGLARIRARKARPGVLALLQVAGRDIGSVSSADLGFAIGPRLNAAGRLEDMRLGIECLLCADEAQALGMAQRLDALNRERRDIEAHMKEDALAMIATVSGAETGISLFEPSWHEGVVGLVASRIKDQLHRPTFAFARAHEAGMLKGSGRSIPGLHIRDAVALVDARHPGLIARFGGHAMAAGLTLAEAGLTTFRAGFDAVCRELLDEAALEKVLDTDGELEGAECDVVTARALEQAGPWGQGFPEPLFEGRFHVREVRRVGDKHARYTLAGFGERPIEAIHFNVADGAVVPGPARFAYRLCVNRWQGYETAELRVEAVVS